MRARPAAVALAGLEPAAVALATGLACSSFGPFFGGWTWLPILAGAVALGVAVGVLASLRRLRWWLAVPVAVLVPALYLIYTGYRAETVFGLPGPAALRALGEGLLSGWARMLTVALPADVIGDLLTTPVLLAYAAALSGTLLALRTARITLLALPPLALFVIGLLFTASRPASRLLLTGAVLAALLLLLLIRSNRVTAAAREGISERDAEAVGLDLGSQRWRSTAGRIGFGLPVVAAVTALGVLAAWLLPIANGTHRYDPRELKKQEFRLASSLTPLVRVKPLLETSPATPLFTVKVAQRGGSYQLDRVRVAALDSFDGALWTQSRDFQITGSTLPEGEPLRPPVVTIDLDIEVARLPDAFLPVAGRAVRVQGSDTAFDPLGGTLVSTRPTVNGYRYTVTGQVRPADAALAATHVATGPAARAAIRLPDAPAWLTTLADEVTSEYRTPMTQLLAIEKYLAQQGYALSARPGHSYGAVHRTLLGTPEERSGYAEQFASAFALLARAKGYPARVAVGYRLSPDKRRDGVYQVDTADAHAWPEVDLAGFGWVAFEPTNTKNAATTTSPRDQTAPVLPDDPNREQPREPEAAAAPAAGKPGGGGTLATRAWQALIGLAMVVLLLILVVTLIVVAKALRRRRRARRGSPAQRIAAAWLETVDRLREQGVRIPAALTPVEVGGVVPAPVRARVAELALVVTTAVCAADEPPAQAATHSWKLEGEIRRTVRGGMPLPVRVRAALDPRPLLPRRVRATGGRKQQSTETAKRALAGSRGGQ
ncbi:MAG TPA: transglutaminaseTgpA domain-containing protein [Micromonosporaceae bacterium]|nr:transglutaminaseTgpA domain-containing protein [Micromonosporaceae bacterium]